MFLSESWMYTTVVIIFLFVYGFEAYSWLSLTITDYWTSFLWNATCVQWFTTSPVVVLVSYLELKKDLMICIIILLSVDGGYSDWSSWSLCSVTCGNGTQQRNRLCTNPPPTNNGAPCRGPAHQTRICASRIWPPIGNHLYSWLRYDFCILISLL